MRRPVSLIPLVIAAVLGAFLISIGERPGRAWAATHASQPADQPHATASRSPVAVAHVAQNGSGIRVTMPPVGLSIEYSVMAAELGTGACPPAALVGELLRLGAPPLELGGASQDLTAPNGALTGTPASWETGALFSLPSTFWSQLHCLLSSVKEPLTAGINAERGSLSWAQQIVAGAQSAASNGLNFSLGNEPDLYILPNYPSLGKKLTLEEDVAAVNLYLRVATYLRQAIGGFASVGPELATAKHWQRQLPGVIAQLHEGVVGVHLYPFSACKDPRAATIPGLLSPRAAERPRSLAWVVADARAAGLPALISEANSISCGGIAGVSDSPASAVWAVRFVLSALKTGFGEVRFHLSGSSYDPFSVRGGEVLRRPLESALFALNRWLPVGSSLRTARGAPGLLETAVSGIAGGPRMILDNEQAKAQTIVLAAAHAVIVESLTAARPGLGALTLRPRGGHIAIRVPPNSVLSTLG